MQKKSIKTKSKAKKVKALAPSIISKEIVINGDVVGEGALEIEGKVEGNVRCLSLVLAESGVVKGDVIAEKVEIHGEVVGELKARSIVCGKTARVIGNITHKRIQIEDGAHVDGNCRKHIGDDEIKRLPSLKLVEENKEEAISA